LLHITAKYKDDLEELKNKPDGLKTCLDCASWVERAAESEQWKNTQRSAQNHPIIPFHQKLKEDCNVISTTTSMLKQVISKNNEEAAKLVQQLDELFKKLKKDREDLQAKISKEPEGQQKLQGNIVAFMTGFMHDNKAQFHQLQAEIKAKQTPA